MKKEMRIERLRKMLNIEMSIKGFNSNKAIQLRIKLNNLLNK
jgi:hypothetical protein